MRKPPPLPRSYDDYEVLGREFEDAERLLSNAQYEEATVALNRLYGQAMDMWTPPFPAGFRSWGNFGTMYEKAEIILLVGVSHSVWKNSGDSFSSSIIRTTGGPNFERSPLSRPVNLIRPLS